MTASSLMIGHRPRSQAIPQSHSEFNHILSLRQYFENERGMSTEDVD